VTRKIVLRAEQNGRDRRNLWASLALDGALVVEGQDLGPATAPVSSDGEYEWSTKIAPGHITQLMVLLGGAADGDVLDLLAERYSGEGSYELERIIRESGIPVERFVWGG
jgi:hypothetical protein